MRCLCGLDKPLSGAIRVDAIDVVENPRLSHTRIGYLADFFGLYSELRVRQVLAYAAAANGMHADVGTAVLATAERLRLSDRLEQNVGELSRGLRQRVAIGQALIHDPKVLILDEPASGLDPEARHDLAELFKTLQATGMTLLVSSHILAELEAYASDMLVIRDGRIVEQRRLRSPTPSKRRIVMRVAGTCESVANLLEQRDDVNNIVIDGERLLCDFSGDDTAQQALLKFLVAADAAVISFATIERDLQQSYLESIRAS
jgi:ABC-2 type transport system ATP-binding protein